MKKVFSVICATAILLGMAAASQAKEEILKGKGAALHEITSPVPGSLDVTTPYRGTITLHSLKNNEVAYWIPEGGKYIMAGDYSYLWCRVYNKNNDKSSYHWLAISSDALTDALNLSHQFTDGIAVYQLSKYGNQIVFKAYPYSTLHAIAEGKKVIDVKE
jgi:hypothetical protein